MYDLVMPVGRVLGTGGFGDGARHWKRKGPKGIVGRA